MRCPPFGRTTKIFYRRLYMKRCVFCHFLARIAKFNNVWWSFAFPNFRKIGEFAVSIKYSKAKNVSAPRPGALPLDPVIGSRSARSPCPPFCQMLNTPLNENHTFCDLDLVTEVEVLLSASSFLRSSELLSGSCLPATSWSTVSQWVITNQ